jgi:hypothetical protein
MLTDLSNADVTKKVITENRPIDQTKILIVKRAAQLLFERRFLERRFLERR